MAFNSNPGRAEYTASAGQTVFPFLFAIFNETDIEVYQTPSGSTPDDTADLLTLTTDYTVTIDGTAGGTITLVTGASINDTIVLKRNLPINRDVDYQTSGDLLADTLDADQDYQTYLTLDSQTTLNRALVLPETDVNMSSVLPATEAGKALFVNSDGTSFEYLSADENAAALRAWEAEAEALTAESYATEAEDVFVKVYTSDGDGTFTATDTTDYSAFHYSKKAESTVVSSGTYTPTASTLTNLDSVTPQIANYQRTGDSIHVWGTITIDATAASLPASFFIDVPINPSVTFSNTSLSGHLGVGTDTTYGIKSATGTFLAQISTHNVVNIVNTAYSFSFIYRL